MKRLVFPPPTPEQQARHQKWKAQRIEAHRSTPYFVYRQFDADNRLLYIGCTLNPDKREREHRKGLWADQIARVEYEMHANYWVAAAHESHYIATEGSLYNALGAPSRGAAAMARRRALAEKASS